MRYERKKRGEGRIEELVNGWTKRKKVCVFFCSPFYSFPRMIRKWAWSLSRKILQKDNFCKYHDIGTSVLQVLWLLWHLAHSDDLPTDIMDQALVAHIKILDFSCSQVNAI